MRDGAEFVGKRIRAQRERLGISQKEFAVSLGVTAPNMNYYEKGSRTPSFDLLVRIAKKLGVSTDEEVISASKVFADLFPRDRKVVIEFIGELKNFQAEVGMGQ